VGFMRVPFDTGYDPSRSLTIPRGAGWGKGVCVCAAGQGEMRGGKKIHPSPPAPLPDGERGEDLAPLDEQIRGPVNLLLGGESTNA
jgi:hypothetical protein